MDSKWFKAKFDDTQHQKDVQMVFAMAVLFGKDSEEFKKAQAYVRKTYPSTEVK